MSTHKVEIVRVPKMDKHPNADSLSVVHLWGYTLVLRTSDWTEGQWAYYIPPDYVVPEKPEYEFLRDKDGRFHGHIRVRRLRGTLSHGLLMPITDQYGQPAKPEYMHSLMLVEGADVMEQFGIKRYEPPADAVAGAHALPAGQEPTSWTPTYDVEDKLRYGYVLEPGEIVLITEKIHGQNVKFMFDATMATFYAGSRAVWKNPETDGQVWSVVRANPWIEEWCRAHPGWTLYGELFGWIQDLKYGAKSHLDKWIRVFDIFTGNDYLSWAHWPDIQLPTLKADRIVPVLYEGPYSEEIVTKLMDGPSLIPGAAHHREGIVIRPIIERTHSEIGRVQVKRVSDLYFEKHK